MTVEHSHVQSTGPLQHHPERLLRSARLDGSIARKKYGLNRVLPIVMFCFGCCTLMVVAVQNFGGLMTWRWFLEVSESAFFPLVIYYQMT